jgi:hypothetical protein
MNVVNRPVVRWRACTATEKRAAVMVARCVRLGVERAREKERGASEGERWLRGILEDLTA